MNNLTMQVLEDGHWVDVSTRARSVAGMVRLYKRMCRESPQGPPYGMRVVTIHMEHKGRFLGSEWKDECDCTL